MMAHVGSKWAPMLLSQLSPRPLRFGELRRALPEITQRMLTLTLRELEQDGLVDRAVTPTIPPRVDYSITPLGRSVAAMIAQLSMIATAVPARLDVEAAADGAVPRDTGVAHP